MAGVVWALLLLTSACGANATHSTQNLVASVGSQDITASQLQSYVQYADAFYAAAYPGTPGRAHCQGQQVDNGNCAPLREQVLGRLLQERVILQYARAHRLTLDGADQSRVNAQMEELVSASSYTADLYSTPQTKQFLHRVLETQALILKVEQAVVGSRARSGFAYELQKYVFPAGAEGRARAYALVRTHGFVAGQATVETVWQAAFRLAPAVSLAASAAKPGEYLGPFQRVGSVLVVRLLAEGIHPYGRTAQVERQTQLFRTWLVAQIKRLHPVCYRRQDLPACRLATMKLS